MTSDTPLAAALIGLRQSGLLLVHDAELPCLTRWVVGEPVRGWAHPRAHEIQAVYAALAEHPDVMLVKLLAGKITLVHRTLWPALLAVATAGEAWQTWRLSPEARALQEAPAAAALAGRVSRRLALKARRHDFSIRSRDAHVHRGKSPHHEHQLLPGRGVSAGGGGDHRPPARGSEPHWP